MNEARMELRSVQMTETPISIKFNLPIRAETTSLKLNTYISSTRFPISRPHKISKRCFPSGWLHSIDFSTQTRSQRLGRSVTRKNELCRNIPSQKTLCTKNKQSAVDSASAVTQDEDLGVSASKKMPSKAPKGPNSVLDSKEANLISVRTTSSLGASRIDDDQGNGNAGVSKSSIENVSVPVSERKECTQSKKKRNRNPPPEDQLRYDLDMCSKRGDLLEAISLYDKALAEGVKLHQYHYNVLLYLCSSAAMGVFRPAKKGKEQIPSRIGLNLQASNMAAEMTDNDKDRNNLKDGTPEEDFEIQITEEMKELTLKRGFEIYERMRSQEIPPNEATFTAVARLAVGKEDGDLAFEMVKQMAASDIIPKLRSYSPALFGFCKNMEAEKAYEVDAHMVASGVQPEELELEALLKLSAEACRQEKVYSILQRLRADVRQVSPSTSKTIEQWFKSKTATKVGTTSWDKEKIREAIVARGGGWHGQGWLGKGKWKVQHTTVTPEGVCRCCGEQLVTIDIDTLETENFAKSVAALARERGATSNFIRYQELLDDHGPFEVVVDGANVGLYQQSQFSFSRLNAVVNHLRERSPSKKWPLIILHNRRTREGPARNRRNKQLIEKWKMVGALYTTPTGSNDDWYWLYAAVKFKCLLVTVDEMRDHIFQLLGTDFFPKWKERHQVRFTFTNQGPQFHMPPPYSIVIQESDRGSWHIPIVGGDDIEISRNWLCITRPRMYERKQRQKPPCQERKLQVLSQLSSTNGAAVYQPAVGNNEITVSSSMSSGFSTHEDVVVVASEAVVEKKRSSVSIPSKSRKNRKGQKLPPGPSSSVPSATLLKIEAAQMLTDCPIDFQI